MVGCSLATCLSPSLVKNLQLYYLCKTLSRNTHTHTHSLNEHSVIFILKYSRKCVSILKKKVSYSVYLHLVTTHLFYVGFRHGANTLPVLQPTNMRVSCNVWNCNTSNGSFGSCALWVMALVYPAYSCSSCRYSVRLGSGEFGGQINSLGRHCDRQAILSCFCSMGSKCQSKSQDPRF